MHKYIMSLFFNDPAKLFFMKMGVIARHANTKADDKGRLSNPFHAQAAPESSCGIKAATQTHDWDSLLRPFKTLRGADFKKQFPKWQSPQIFELCSIREKKHLYQFTGIQTDRELRWVFFFFLKLWPSNIHLPGVRFGKLQPGYSALARQTKHP